MANSPVRFRHDTTALPHLPPYILHSDGDVIHNLYAKRLHLLKCLTQFILPV